MVQVQPIEKVLNDLAFGRQRKGGQFRNCYFSPIQCALVASKRNAMDGNVYPF